MSSIHPNDVIAELNFIKPDTTIEPVVIYSGGSTPQIYNEAYKLIPVPIIDVRNYMENSAEKFSVDKQGFEITKLDSQHQDFDNPDTTSDVYYKEVEQLIKETTVAAHVFVFDHTVRKGIPGSSRRPAHHVHNDYTNETGVSVAEESINPEIFASMAGKRMIQINVWKSINGTVHRSPLAFLDASSVEYNDLVKTQIHFKDTDMVGEIFAVRHKPEQRWMFFSEITENEALLIKGYDTDLSGVARFTPHTAFEYPNQDETAPARHSIEARAFAFYD